MEDIIKVVQSLGINVVALLACAWYVKYREDKNDERLANYDKRFDAQNNMHQEEMNKMVDAVNNNTVILTLIKEALLDSNKGDKNG